MAQPPKTAVTRRRRILDAAARVVRQKGRGATIDDIAKEANYSPAALYRHFPGKDAIFQGLSHEIGARMLEIFSEAPPLKLSFEQHLKWVLYRLAEFANDERDVFIAAISWAPPVGLESDEANAHRSAFGDAMIALMKQGIEEGVLREEAPELYAMAFGGMLNALNEAWILTGPFDLKPRIDELYTLFLRGASPA